ncbi:MAG: hypothetical protein WC506_05205 [Candidatus Micrarchaeia archaeon]
MEKRREPGRGRQGNAKGFIFSLDSFIALSLVLVSIYSLFVLVSVPKTFYNSHLQAYDLARDSLNSLGNLQYNSTSPSEQGYSDKGYSYLERIGINMGIGQYSSGNITKQALDPIIPVQYGYRLDAYSISQSKWVTIYDTANDTTTQHNRVYRKLSATAQSLAAGYRTPPSPTGLPDCGKVQNQFICASNPGIIFEEGDVFVSVIRLTVYI